MWFDKSVQDAYRLGIKEVLDKLKYSPKRVDEHQHNNKIDIEIFKLIEKSKFLIADLTGNRGGVYYEAGYAKGLGLQVIYSVKRDWFDKVHFDLNHENLIVWDTIEELKEALEKRVLATFGEYKEPIEESPTSNWGFDDDEVPF